MIEVTQTTCGFPDQDSPPGDCLAACVASVLEVPLECVPRTRLIHEMADWLRVRGLYSLSCRCDLGKGYIVPAGYHLLGGWSPRRPDRRDMLHFVVARGREIVWDPHPSRAGLLDWQETTVLVPLDPVDVRVPTMTTDLRAALRDLCEAIEGNRATSSDRIAAYRALADAPPTVAELLAELPEPTAGRGPGSHRVEWEHDDMRIRAIRYGIAGLVVERHLDGEWSRTNLNHADMNQPGLLVEVPS